ncbi:hypothetical protein BDR07DRAFT_1383390 [Suillus spraguei]|nr:hypothetical protein BDR07DRAFT_1383390 [Suillus spraguei]
METCAKPTSRQPSNIFISSSDPPSFSDDTEPWDYSSDAYMVSNEVIDQDIDVDISQEKSASEVSADQAIAITCSDSNTKSMTTLTLSANMSKVAKACQKSQASFKSESLMWNEKFLKFFSSLGFDWTRSDELQSDIKRQIGKAMASKDVQKQIKTHMHIIVQNGGLERCQAGAFAKDIINNCQTHKYLKSAIEEPLSH